MRSDSARNAPRRSRAQESARSEAAVAVRALSTKPDCSAVPIFGLAHRVRPWPSGHDSIAILDHEAVDQRVCASGSRRRSNDHEDCEKQQPQVQECPAIGTGMRSHGDSFVRADRETMDCRILSSERGRRQGNIRRPDRRKRRWGIELQTRLRARRCVGVRPTHEKRQTANDSRGTREGVLFGCARFRY